MSQAATASTTSEGTSCAGGRARRVSTERVETRNLKKRKESKREELRQQSTTDHDEQVGSRDQKRRAIFALAELAEVLGALDDLAEEIDARLGRVLVSERLLDGDHVREVLRDALRVVLREELKPEASLPCKGDGWLSVKNAAAVANVNEKTIRRWIGRRLLKAFKVGSLWRVKESDLNRMLEESAHQGTAFDAAKEADRIIHLRRSRRSK